MAVVALQLDVGLGQSQLHKGLGLTGFDANAELGIHLAGGNRVEGVGIDARGQPKDNLLPDPSLSGDVIDGQQLFLVVHHKVAHAVIHGKADIFIGLAVGVEVGLFHGEAGLAGGVDLAHGDHVRTHAFLGADGVDPLKAGGLAGV